VANTGKDAAGGTIYLRKAFGTGVDDTNAYTFGNAVYFSRNGLEALCVLDTSTPANNRPFPVLALSADGAAPFDVNSGAAGATTLRNVLATRHEAAPTPLSVRLSDGSAFLTNLATNLVQLNGNTVSSGNGAAGTGTLRVSIANDSTGIVAVDGFIAHDSADTAGNQPVKTGARAVSSLESQTMVTADDVAHNVSDLDGSQIIRNQAPLADLVADRVADTGGTSTAFTNMNAGGSGVRNYLTTLHVYNSSTTNGFVDIRDGTAGSVIWTIAAPALSGAVITFNPPLRQPTANTALAHDVSAAISTVYISVAGFQSKCG
jgi:hypothetical protein